MENTNYKTLTQDEMDDIIVSFLHQQELELFCHSINLERYTNMIKDENLPEGNFKDNLKKLKKELETRITEVKGIVENTKSQLPSEERIKASLIRIEKAKKNI